MYDISGMWRFIDANADVDYEVWKKD